MCEMCDTTKVETNMRDAASDYLAARAKQRQERAAAEAYASYSHPLEPIVNKRVEVRKSEAAVRQFGDNRNPAYGKAFATMAEVPPSGFVIEKFAGMKAQRDSSGLLAEDLEATLQLLRQIRTRVALAIDAIEDIKERV